MTTPVPADLGPKPRDPGSGRRARRQPSIRWQVLGTVLVINILAALAAGLGILWNARARTDHEMKASVELAERLVRDSVARFVAEPSTARLERWTVQERGLRHVRIRVEHEDGATTDLVSPPTRGENGAPRWFAALVGAQEIARTILIVVEGETIGRVVVTGTPSDEIAEIWADVRDFLAIAVGVDLAILLALSFALERVLAQIRYVAEGLGELEKGRFGHRMAAPASRELTALTERFNALAGALDAARQDNARLTRALVSTQDDERRQIAADLHDELGPCLFGLEANAGSLERLLGETSVPTASKMRERIATLVEIVGRMRILNRRLLQKLRPVAIDHVPLADVIANLVAEFERHAPEQRLDLALGPLAPRYGDFIDLTLYRCIQEGVTNALKHGGAERVRIAAREVFDAAGRRLCLRIEDDGRGLPAEPALGRGLPGRGLPGMGLPGMRDRVRALGGRFAIVAAAAGGARIEIEIPLGPESPEGDAPRPGAGGSS